MIARPLQVLVGALVMLSVGSACTSASTTQKSISLRLLVVGDSICMFQIGQHLLADAFAADGYKVQFVGVGTTSNAFGGFSASNLLHLTQQTTRANADVILVQAGTNDIGIWKDGPQPAKNFDSLLAELRKDYKGVPIFVAPLTPIMPKNVGKAKPIWIDAFNAKLPDICKRNDCKFIGFLPATFISVGYAPDGVHPNKAGLKILSQRWADAVASSKVNRKNLALPIARERSTSSSTGLMVKQRRQP